MTSLFRLEVSVPWRSRRSRTTVSRKRGASRATTARPTTPAPTTVRGVSAIAAILHTAGAEQTGGPEDDTMVRAHAPAPFPVRRAPPPPAGRRDGAGAPEPP